MYMNQYRILKIEIIDNNLYIPPDLEIIEDGEYLI